MKEQAEFLYQKSSHYISGTFLAVGTILAIVSGFSYYVPFMILSILLETLQLGVIRASLKAYDRKGKEVDTLNYTLMGLKEYPSAFSVFVGKKIIIIAIQLLIILLSMVISSGNVDNVMSCLKSLLTGTTDFIFARDSNNIIQWFIPAGMIIGEVVAVLVGLFLDIKFTLSYYFAVDKDYSLFESLSASWKAMKGNTFKYISLLLKYLFPYLGATIAIFLANMALTNGFTQLMGMLPSIAIPIAIVMTVLIALAATTFSVMIYRVKLQLAITVFYKEITK